MAVSRPIFDVIVIGGGIVGCACTRECALSGLQVALIEPHVIGGGATAAGMGHIVVMDDSAAQMALTNYSRSIWMKLLPHLPSAVEYETRGTVWVAADDEEMSEVYAKRDGYALAGVESFVLDAQALTEAEPNLRTHLAGGLLVPQDGVLYPPAAAAFFLEEAVRKGAVLVKGERAISIGHNAVSISNGDVYHGAQIIVASGVDVRLVPGLKIQRRKGHLLITERYPGFVNHQLVELGYLKSAHKFAADSVAFNVQPRQTGQLLIGSSRQYGNEDPAVDQYVLARMLDRACEYMPGLNKLSGIRAWTGFRAATPDKLPLIGPTDDASVFLAMGFEGLGITDAPGAARLIVAHITGSSFPIDAAPYLPARLSSISPATELAHA